MGTSADRGSGCLRLLLGGVLLVIVLVLCGGGTILYEWHRATEPPDVAAEARSPLVAGRSDAARTALDTRLAAVTAAAPGLRALATSVEDVCIAEPGGFFGGGYGPVRCTRTLTRYLAADGDADGDAAARARAWDRALRAAGWSGGATAHPAGAPYADDLGAVLRIEWVERPSVPSTHRPIEAGRRPVDSDTRVYRAAEPVDVAATVGAAFARHRHVAVVSLELRYHDGVDPEASPTPGGGYRPCHSGSGDCVGG